MKKRGMYRIGGALLISLGVSVFLLTGCGGSASGGSSGKAWKPEIKIAVNAAPDTLDLGKTTAVIAKEIALGNVFESLVALDKNFTPQPELAEKIDISPDHMVYTYHLRKGVLFHNGKEMKAEDAAASMNRWIENYGAAKRAVGTARFTASDEYTISIHLHKPLTILNELIAEASQSAIIVPKEEIEKADPQTGILKNLIGTGPYKVDSIVPDSGITLKKFDQYKPYGKQGELSGSWGYKEAKTPVIHYEFVTDSSTRTAGMQSGEYDVAVQMSADDYGQFKGNPDFQVFKEEDGEIGMVYNKKAGLMSSAAMRRAVNTLLNDQDIMKAAYVEDDFSRLTSSYIIDSENPWYSENGKEYYNQGNVPKAKELLRQAGYQGEEFRLLVSSHYPAFYNAAVVAEREMKEAGMNVRLDVVDWGTYLDKSKNPEAYDAFITGFSKHTIPSAVIYLSSSWNGWSSDPHLQETLAALDSMPDKEEARRTWGELQGYLWSDYMPVSKFGNKYNYDVASSHVKGLILFQGTHAWNVEVSE